MATASPISTLSPSYLAQMTGTCQALLTVIHDLCKYTSKRSPTNAWYCFPSEEWLAQRIGKSRVQVSRALQKLERLGLIAITHRRKVQGYFQTNLYRLGHELLRGLGRLKEAIFAISNRVSSMIHKVHNSHYENSLKGTKSDFSVRNRGPTLEETLKRLTEKFGF